MLRVVREFGVRCGSAGAVVALALAAACGGGGGGGDGAPETVAVSGRLVAVSSASAGGVGRSVAVVAVDESGAVADGVVTQGSFTLRLPVDHDDCIVFRDGSVEGRTLGVLQVAAGGGTVFHVAPGMGPVDLGEVTLHTATGLARASGGLGGDFVGPASRYPDTDGDRIPDAMDRDDDGDGVRDADDCAPRDAQRHLALTTGRCVVDDEDDDDDHVADAADAAPLDPAVQTDADSDPDVARLLAALGHWSLTYTMLITYNDTFDFDLVDQGDSGVFASGRNQDGQYAVMTVGDTGLSDFAIYTTNADYADAYMVNLAGTAVTGEYYLADGFSADIVAGPFTLFGTFEPLGVATSSLAGPEGAAAAAGPGVAQGVGSGGAPRRLGGGGPRACGPHRPGPPSSPPHVPPCPGGGLRLPAGPPRTLHGQGGRGKIAARVAALSGRGGGGGVETTDREEGRS